MALQINATRAAHEAGRILLRDAGTADSSPAHLSSALRLWSCLFKDLVMAKFSFRVRTVHFVTLLAVRCSLACQVRRSHQPCLRLEIV